LSAGQNHASRYAGGKAIAVHGDVSKQADAQGIVDAAIKQFGKLDVLVNNSGVYEFAPIEAITEESFHRQFNINVLGLLLTTQAANKHLGEGASIINICSVVNRITPAASAVYTGTKCAVAAITGVLSRELGPRKIRVNSLNPGMIETEGAHTAGFIGSDFEAGAVANTPLGRIGQPNDIASIAVFLASNDSYWLTGEQLFVNRDEKNREVDAYMGFPGSLRNIINFTVPDAYQAFELQNPKTTI